MAAPPDSTSPLVRAATERVGNSTLYVVLGSRMFYAKSRLVVRLLSVRGCSSSWCSCSFAVRYSALADPRLPYGAPRLRAGSLDVVMIIDVSKSMGAEDYHPDSRLNKVREIILEMLPQLRGNRVGFVTFAGNSFRQAELSEDFTALEFILKHWVASIRQGLAVQTSSVPWRPGSPSCRKRQTETVSSCSFQTAGMRRRILTRY